MDSDMIDVHAAPGLRVPTEANARRYIEDEAQSVPRTAYYLRRIAAGELLYAGSIMPGAVQSTTASTAAKKGA